MLLSPQGCARRGREDEPDAFDGGDDVLAGRGRRAGREPRRPGRAAVAARARCGRRTSAATCTRSPMSRLTSRSRARRAPARPRAARRQCQATVAPPPTSAATTSCSGSAEPEVGGDRAGDQAERDHQQVERPGAELGGDGDAGRDPPDACDSERSIAHLRSVVAAHQCRARSQCRAAARRTKTAWPGPTLRAFPIAACARPADAALPVSRSSSSTRTSAPRTPRASASARSPQAIEKEGIEVLGVTSYGDLSQFAQQQSRASPSSCRSTTRSSAPAARSSTRRCCNLRTFIEEIRFKNAEIPIYLYGETRTSRHIPNDILRELHGFIHMFEDTPEFVARHIIREAQGVPRRRSRRRSSARWSTTRRTARTRGTARATRAASPS